MENDDPVKIDGRAQWRALGDYWHAESPDRMAMLLGLLGPRGAAAYEHDGDVVERAA